MSGESLRRALLIDLFDTVIATAFESVTSELTTAIGCTRADLVAQLRATGPALMTTTTGYEQFFVGLLRAVGRPVSDDEIARFLDLDRELLISHSRVHDDARELIEHATDIGVPIALVSNCAPNARAVIDHFGISQWVNEVVLSCDVGVAKPEAGIFEVACERLGVRPHESVFVDDQVKYCLGAAELGIDAFLVVRDGSDRVESINAGPASIRVVTSCRDLVSRTF